MSYLDSLPSRTGAFSAVSNNGQISTVRPRRYVHLPSSGGGGVEVKTDKIRSLIRALQSTSKSTSRLPSTIEENRPRPPKRARESVTPTWNSLQKERKQSCLRVALTAACAAPHASRTLLQLQAEWRRDPRKKQKLTSHIREELARSASSWTTTQLRNYMYNADVAPRASRSELVHQVSFHLSPGRCSSPPQSSGPIAPDAAPK